MPSPSAAEYHDAHIAAEEEDYASPHEDSGEDSESEEESEDEEEEEEEEEEVVVGGSGLGAAYRPSEQLVWMGGNVLT